MTKTEFIKNIAVYVAKYAPRYGIKVHSPIIAQAVLESASGTSELAVNANNFFGLKYNPNQPNRCPSAKGYYVKKGSEQNPDGSYTSSTMLWQKFDNMEDGVIGYFDFINTSRYANLKGVTEPKVYLENIKADGYATSLSYVSNLLKVIENYNLTQYDNNEEKEQVSNMASYVLKKNIANKSNYGNKRDTSQIQYIVIHWTANDGDTDENNGKYFANNVVKASAHYFVDDDSVTQSVPDDYSAWAVGDNRWSNYKTTGGAKLYGIVKNNNSLSIEICDDVKNGVVYPSAQTIANVLALTKEKMKQYNVPKERVIRHFDVSGKNCPDYWCGTSEKEAKWKSEFWDKLDGGTQASTPSTTNTYTVVSGDTLSKIGTKTGVDWKLIAELNGIKFPYIIKKGQVLKLAETTTPTQNPSIPVEFTYSLTQFIKDVQMATGAKVDGKAGKETISKTVTVSSTKNRRHAVVKAIQKRLNSLGYDCGTVDGDAGVKFTNAVNRYQSEVMGYKKVDGKITAKGKMWKKLLGMI